MSFIPWFFLSNDRKLVRAAKSGKIDIVREMLNKGANVNAIDMSGRTSLMRASSKGHAETVKLLMDNGADVNAKDGGHHTALMFASRKGHTESVELLIQNGADVNACRECDHEISSEVRTCPNCGFPTQAKKKVRPAFLPILMLGTVITLFGSVLVWDSLLWLMPEPFDVPRADWKEFGIGCGALLAGIILCIVGCLLSAEKGHFLSTEGKAVFPLSCVVFVILVGLVFKLEIHDPYWFTSYLDVNIKKDGKKVWNDVRMRYSIPFSEFHK